MKALLFVIVLAVISFFFLSYFVIIFMNYPMKNSKKHGKFIKNTLCNFFLSQKFKKNFKIL